MSKIDDYRALVALRAALTPVLAELAQGGSEEDAPLRIIKNGEWISLKYQGDAALSTAAQQALWMHAVDGMRETLPDLAVGIGEKLTTAVALAKVAAQEEAAAFLVETQG